MVDFVSQEQAGAFFATIPKYSDDFDVHVSFSDTRLHAGEHTTDVKSIKECKSTHRIDHVLNLADACDEPRVVIWLFYPDELIFSKSFISYWNSSLNECMDALGHKTHMRYCALIPDQTGKIFYPCYVNKKIQSFTHQVPHYDAYDKDAQWACIKAFLRSDVANFYIKASDIQYINLREHDPLRIQIVTI
jgi:hypothetical protein